ncbi:DUF924 family protein [Microbulbifer sp. 2201CG32-9]
MIASRQLSFYSDKMVLAMHLDAPTVTFSQGAVPQPAQILCAWFGSAELRAPVEEPYRRLWFSPSEANDKGLARDFGQVVERALAGQLDDWSATLTGELALVLLCDQFTRNIYRGTSSAFAGDARAQQLALAVIQRGDHHRLGLYQRAFLGMPLEHGESEEMQQRSVAFFDQLRKVRWNSAEETAQADSFYQYAVAHRDVIDRFGRYPHRNAALGRVSRPEERQWLAQGGGF